MQKHNGVYAENHYCSGCGATNRFLSTEKLIPFENRVYLVMNCQVCCKSIWRTVEEDGHPVLSEVCDG